MRLLVLALLLTPITLLGQSAEDTKDFIREKIEANNPIPSYDNFAFFENILKPDADYFAGKTLSDEEFKYLFIYARECHFTDDHSSGVWLTVAESIDIRGITKVSTTKKTGEHSFYSIKVYLSGNYHAKSYSAPIRGEEEWEYLPHMEILIGNNSEAAAKIKKGIIHLGKVYDITIKDGDLF